tara:strand:- start:785 stop:1258 length:474 start_codon:yes stop_codon:yes gene_type:complete
MAHFAKIGTNGKVLQVLTLNNEDMLDANGFENEEVGQQHLERHNNWPAQMWVQTSYNTRLGKYLNADGSEAADQSKAVRGNYAMIGSTWDEDNQIFWNKKPYPSWVKNTTTACWQSPIGDAPALTAEQTSQNEAGTHGWNYIWNEDNQSWDLTDLLT